MADEVIRLLKVAGLLAQPLFTAAISIPRSVWLIETDTSVRTFGALIKAAQHAQQLGWEKELKARAQSRLSADDYDKLLREI